MLIRGVAMTAYVNWAVDLNVAAEDAAFAATLVAKASKYFFSVTLALTLVCTGTSLDL